MPKHPSEVLTAGEKSPPIIPAAEHFAGTEDRISKAFSLQEKMNAVFDITMDCEDGAPTGAEKEHAEMVVRMQNSDLNKYNQAGVRIHDPANPHWRQDVEIVVRGAGERVRYITIPKSMSVAACAEVIDTIRNTTAKAGIKREIPIHVLMETQAALRVVWDLAALPNVEVLDFGLMDFVSDHHGAIPSSAMKSPWQFDHALLRRAKAETVAAALANGVVPAHNVTLELKDIDFIHNDARRAREEFGFLRQWSIYPMQIEPIVRAMAPAAPEVAEAEAIMLRAYDADWGPIQYEGNLHDRATYRYYWEQLQRAKVMGLALAPRTVQTFFA
ncbi:MAG: aldolase/citrate lyase family protein [Dehalococcoidia bacterium]|nr:CoA ester lyase [Dehalococcoidia bacterium]MCB9484745.1 CoA ester lyase [Thermoflexaceae bacterium]